MLLQLVGALQVGQQPLGRLRAAPHRPRGTAASLRERDVAGGGGGGGDWGLGSGRRRFGWVLFDLVGFLLWESLRGCRSFARKEPQRWGGREGRRSFFPIVVVGVVFYAKVPGVAAHLHPAPSVVSLADHLIP